MIVVRQFRVVMQWVMASAAITIGMGANSIHAAIPETDGPLTVSELQALVDPIALYPDPLLKNILAASTFPDQVIDAALLVQSKEDAQKIELHNWDTSVKIIASYPGVLSMMHRKIDWTTSLGEAFMNQHRDLLAAIQTLRRQAKESGELASNNQQKVAAQPTNSGGEVITIEPQNPQIIYVPSDPVYVSSGGGYVEDDDDDALVPLATFGLGLALGAAMNDDDDDHYYYSGWGGPAYWYDDSPYDQWMDNRREAWEDHNDRAWDRQDHRQDMRKDRQDFRQDSVRDGTWNPPSAEQRSAARQNVESRQADRQASRTNTATRSNTTGSTSRGTFSRAGSADYSRTAAASSYSRSGSRSIYSGSTSAQSRGWSTQSASRSQSRSAFSGYGSRGQVSHYGSRGSVSRSSGGFSRGGGGGGFRGGGGGGRRR